MFFLRISLFTYIITIERCVDTERKIFMEIAKLIRERRLELGLTMKQLGQKAGASESAVSRWEAGETDNMKRTNIVKVADALHISPLAFLGYDISDKKTVKIPIVGHVVAGTPIFAQENIEGMVEINERDSKGVMFALKVIGHSMEPRIQEGDLLIIHKQDDVESGDIAIVLINGDEATVKQVKKQADGIMLIGFNQDVYEPHFYSNKQIEQLPIRIMGKVVESRHVW
jgi:repressor LexA